MSEKTRREFLKSGALGIAGLTLGGSFLAACGGGSDGGGDGGETAADTSAPPADTGATETVAGGGGTSGESIKVGLVNALTGVLSVTEKSIYQEGSSPSMRSTPLVAFRGDRSRLSPRTTPRTSLSRSRRPRSSYLKMRSRS